MLYEDYETGISHDALSKVVSALPAPVCLLGGWAVYYTVNANYSASTGNSYHGSRDIDLGFHLEDDATDKLLRESALAGSIESLRGMGFRSMGVRMFKEYHRETRLLLSEAKAKKTPSYNIFQLYVDLLVDNAPAGIKKAIGFTPFDEKMLVHVFGGKMFKAIDEFPTRVILPTPPVLLAMKMASLPNRTKDHKKHKDIMDMYALIWHSGVPLKRLRLGVSRLVSAPDMLKAVSSIGKPDYEQAADSLGIDEEKVKSVLSDFVRAPAATRRDKGGWALPANMSYDRLITAIKALLVSGADQKEVEIEGLAKKVGVTADTVRRGVSFLQIVGVVESSGRNRCSLTAAGASYAGAHLDGNARQIERHTLDMISRSHLAELADVIRTSKNVTREDLYKRIKAFGSHSDGKGTGGMHAPAAAGATTVLRLFEDAGLLARASPADGGADDAGGGGGGAARGGGRPRGGRPGPGGGGAMQALSGGAAPLDADGMGDQAVLAVKGVGQVRVNDLKTLRVAEMYMDMLREMLSEGASRSNKRGS